MGVFMREPLLDWQREARVVNAKRSVPASAKDAVSAAETADPADMHVNLKVYLLIDVPCLITKFCPCATVPFITQVHSVSSSAREARESALAILLGGKHIPGRHSHS